MKLNMNVKSTICILAMLLVQVSAGPFIPISPIKWILDKIFFWRDPPSESMAPTPAMSDEAAPPDTTLNFVSSGKLTGSSSTEKVGTAVALNNVGTRLAVGGNSQLMIYDSFTSNADNSTGWIMKADLSSEISGWIQAIDMSSDGNFIVVSQTATDITDPSVESPADCTVKIFEKEADGTWSQVGDDIVSETTGDGFGASVVISDGGDVIAIGSPLGNSVDVMFLSIDTEWSLTIDGFDADSYFGASLSLSADGNTLAVGAPHENNFRGAVHVINISTRQQTHELTGTDAGDNFGTKTVLSSDSTTLAVGSTASSGTTFAQVYRYDSFTDTYVQAGPDVSGSGTRATGWSIALSSNGGLVLIGMPYNDDAGTNAGKSTGIAVTDSTLEVVASFPGDASGDLSGTSVAVSGDGTAVAIGAVGSSTGHVRVFNLV